MPSRRQTVLDAAITVVGEQGVRALTHRAVDAGAGLPAGSTSNLFRTREALLDGVVDRFVLRERESWDLLTARRPPANRSQLAGALSAFAREAVGQNRTRTLARYALLVEAGHRPALRPRLARGGAEATGWAQRWITGAGSTDPDRDAHLVLNYWTGLVLHELAIPDPDFDPLPRIEVLLAGLLPVTPSTPTTAPSTRSTTR